jgi:hypothetical protein
MSDAAHYQGTLFPFLDSVTQVTKRKRVRRKEHKRTTVYLEKVRTGEYTKLCANCGATFTRRKRMGSETWSTMRHCSHACRCDPMRRFMKLASPEPNTGCWLWAGVAITGGYGHFSINGRSRSAHRASYELFRGKIPSGLVVCHTCDVRLCVNPDHLFVGTQSDNMRDAVAKGRLPSGEAHFSAVLTDRVVWCIRHSPWSAAEAAKMHKITRDRVNSIRAGIGWKHIKFGVNLPK